jgi:hypothetical protein
VDLQFFQQLKRIAHEERVGMQNQINQLETTVAQLMLNLDAMLPQQNESVLQTLVRDLQSRLHAMKCAGNSVQDYFSGKGPVAKKLQEYSSIFGWMIPGGGLRDVATQLRAFDFHPIADVNVVGNLNRFLMSIRDQVNDLSFTTPMPPVGTANFNALQTGIYGEGPFSENYTIVLRTHTKDRMGIEAIFVCPPSEEAVLAYWHPFEQAWVYSDYTSSWQHIQGLLEQEFYRAMEEANQLVKGFDFVTEIIRLTERCQKSIFAMASFLPNYRYQTRGSGSLDAVYEKDAHGGGSIYCRIKDMSLVFQASSAPYYTCTPSVLMFVESTGSVIGSVPPESLPREMQRLLIQRATQVLTFLEKDIETARMTRGSEAAIPQATHSGYKTNYPIN